MRTLMPYHAITTNPGKILLSLTAAASLGLSGMVCATEQVHHCCPGFGDPDHVVKMDAEWQNKTLSYYKNAGAADMVIALGQQTYPALHDFIAAYAAKKMSE